MLLFWCSKRHMKEKSKIYASLVLEFLIFYSKHFKIIFSSDRILNMEFKIALKKIEENEMKGIEGIEF